MLYGELQTITLESGETIDGFKITVPEPPKAAIVRLPTASEMADRLSRQKSIRRNLGRRKSETEFLQDPKADLDLFNKIQVKLIKGDPFDEFEAGTAIGKLTRAEPDSCERNGEGYVVTLKTPFGKVTHHLNIPTARDLSFYRRAALKSTDLPHGQEELRYPVEPACALYDAVVRKVDGFEGYAAGYRISDIPPHHKSNAVVELVQALDELDTDLSPNS